MKTIKTFLLAMICISMAACMSNDDSYQAGFPMLATKYAYRYANNTSDTELWQLEHNPHQCWR